MAWKERDWYLGGLYRDLFDNAGNAGPTAWVDGRVVGLWAQRANLEVGYRLLLDVGREARVALDAEAARLTEWLGTDRVFPRFPNPMFRELAASSAPVRRPGRRAGSACTAGSPPVPRPRGSGT